MHASAMEAAKEFMDKHVHTMSRVADIGSRDVNWSLRSLFDQHDYFGYDIVFLLVPMPNAHRHHAHPIDCWRCYTEGMRGLFDDAGLDTVHLYEANDHDTVGIGRKP
jgi:hypothetical protein